MTARLSRRAALGGLALMAMPVVLSRPASAGGGRLAFSVARGADDIGEHVVDFTLEGDDLHVEIAIRLEVTFASVPVFRYEHVNREHWRAGRLLALESHTDDDGTAYAVTARAVAGGLAVEGAEGRLLVDAGTLTTAYWHPRTVHQDRLIDTQKGRLLSLENRYLGRDTVEVAGELLPASRYGVGGDLAMTLWYGPNAQWCGLAFDGRGKEVRYRAVERLPEALWSAIAGTTA